MKPRKLRKITLSKRLQNRLTETKIWKSIWEKFRKGRLHSFTGYNSRGGLRRGPIVKSRRQAWFIAISMSGRELGYRVSIK